MYRKMTALLVGLAIAGAPVAAQQPGRQGHGPPPQTQGYQQMERQQEMLREMDRLMARIQETNQWMNQHRTQEHYQELGRHMAQTGERIRDMLHRTEQLYTPELDRDRDRIRDVDQLRDRLHDMERDLDRAHDALQKAIGKR